MKKYPFSKKAVQAMLAATIALSPVAAFGAVDAHAEGAEYTVASYGSVQELITRLDADYDKLSQDQKNELRQMQTKVYNIIASDWVGYTNKIFINSVTSATAPEAVMLQQIVGLSNATTTAELQDKIEGFKSLNRSENLVNAVFGSSITEDELLNYIASVELEYKSIINSKKMQIAGIIAADPNASDIITEILDQISNGQSIDGLQLQLVNLNNINFSQNTIDQLSDVLGSALKEAMETVGAQLQHAKVNTALEDKLKTKAEVKAVFKEIVAAYFYVPSTGGGGGGTPTPTPQPTPGEGEVTVPNGAAEVIKETKNGQTEVVTKVSQTKVSEIVSSITTEKPVVLLQLAKPAAGETAKAQLPASLFTEAAQKNSDAAINIKTEEASYKLPVSEINVTDLAKALGVAASDVQITIAVNVVEPTAAEVAEFVKNNKPVSKIIEFEVKAVSGNKEVPVTTYRYYAERVIKLDSEVSTSSVNASAGAKLNVNNLAGVRINEDGSFSPVPTVFNGDEATIKSLTNSKYTIVENSKTFTDVDNGANYFEANIEKLASKYIINGKTDSTYAPSADITRGEFAALISRSLGLVAKNPAEVKFPDVPATKAVNKNGEINAAVEAGIIQGFPNGEFKPDQPMTRAEAAIMIDRAMTFTKVADSKLDKTKKVTSLADHDSISNTSRSSIEKVYQAGIMGGFNNGEFGPYQNTQRDQMAKVLDKFLQVSGMIN